MGSEPSLDPEEIRHADQLAEQLLERKDRLQYFIISASAAIFLFTFDDMNAPESILRLAPRLLVVLAWSCLVGAVAAAFIIIYVRHHRSGERLRLLYEGKPLEKPSQTARQLVVAFEIAELLLLPVALILICVGFLGAWD